MSLIAKGLGFAYPKGPPLLSDLDLLLPVGTSASVMAPSGIGKSTLLAVLGGLRRPNAGTVEISGDQTEIAASPKFARPRFAWVFQSMHLLFARTALDNVTMTVMPRGSRRAVAEDLARNQLERFGVGELAERPVGLLSGGQRQRVALARVAAADPMVVLADEPTAHLDRDNALAVARVLVEGFPRACVVVATHDPAVAELASVRYTLRGGRLDKGT